MSLTPEQMAAREGRLTASRIACLMSGDAAGILNLWRGMIGDPAFVAEDLSEDWPVQLGSWTEQLNLNWYERKTGKRVTRRGEVAVHPEHDWAAATLDGFDGAHVIEAKHVGGREPRARIIERYAPQCVWQRIVTGYPVLMSIIEGANEPVIEPAAWDEGYAAELLRRGRWFMGCVADLTPPVALEPVAPPVDPTKWRTFHLDQLVGFGAQLPNWCEELREKAAAWATTAPAAKRNKAAAEEIKELLPDDVGLCTSGSVKIKRAKNGAVRIEEIAAR